MTHNSRRKGLVLAATHLLLIATTVSCSEDSALTQEEAEAVAHIVLGVLHEGYLYGESDDDDFPIRYRYTGECSQGGVMAQSGTLDAGFFGDDESPDSAYVEWQVDATPSECAETENGIPVTLDGDVSFDMRYTVYLTSDYELDISASGTLNGLLTVLNRNSAVSDSCPLETHMGVQVDMVATDGEVVSGEGMAGKACGHSIVIDANRLWTSYVNLD